MLKRSQTFARLKLAFLALCITFHAACNLNLGFKAEEALFECEDVKCAVGFLCNADGECVAPEPLLDAGEPIADVSITDIASDQGATPDTGTIADQQESPDDSGSTNSDSATPTGDDGQSDPCQGISAPGCCSTSGGVQSAFTCTKPANTLVSNECTGGLQCGWGGSYYLCGESGGADPSGEHPFICPGESCQGDCSDKDECTYDGCGNQCGCVGANQVCTSTGAESLSDNPWTCECAPGYIENSQGECLEEPFTCPDICSGCTGDDTCTIDCDKHKDKGLNYCNEAITCPPGMLCNVICNENDSCSKGITAGPETTQLNVSCLKKDTCRGPIESLSPATIVNCTHDKSCRICPLIETKCAEGFSLECAGDNCTLECEKNGNPGAAIDGKCNGPKICSANHCTFNCNAKWSCGGSIECDQSNTSEQSICDINCGIQSFPAGPVNTCQDPIDVQGSDTLNLNCWSNKSCGNIRVQDSGDANIKCDAENACTPPLSVTPGESDIEEGLHCNAESCEVWCNGKSSCPTVKVKHADSATINCTGIQSCGQLVRCEELEGSCQVTCSNNDSCSNVQIDSAVQGTVTCNSDDSCKGELSCAGVTEACTFNCGNNNTCKGTISCHDTATCKLSCSSQNSCNGGIYLCADSDSCHIFPNTSNGGGIEVIAQNKLFRYQSIDNINTDLSPKQCALGFCNGGETGCCISSTPLLSCCNWEEIPD